MKNNLKLMIQIALVTAVICVVAPFSIPLPFSPVPITLALFAIFLGVYALGWKWSTVSVLLYILIGLIGVPVFSNFSGGIGKLMGPTGGYIIGYVLTSVIAGLFIDKFEKKIYLHVIGMVLGVAACYLFGTVWFVYTMEGYDFIKALGVCVIPYIPADIVKMILAAIVGPAIRKGIKKVNSN